MAATLTLTLEIVAIIFAGLSALAAALAVFLGKKRLLQSKLRSSDKLESDIEQMVVEMHLPHILPRILSALPVIYGGAVGVLALSSTLFPTIVAATSLLRDALNSFLQ